MAIISFKLLLQPSSVDIAKEATENLGQNMPVYSTKPGPANMKC
jgi:hypothetical protein